MIENLCEMIMDKMQQIHHMTLKEWHEGFTDSHNLFHDLFHAKLEHQLSRRNPGQAAVWEQTLVNNHVRYLEHYQ